MNGLLVACHPHDRTPHYRITFMLMRGTQSVKIRSLTIAAGSDGSSLRSFTMPLTVCALKEGKE